ncbi:putative FBD-associated F-box protein At5g22720 isoform X2 [Lotus japonicus]|nr:putative FBD-associated F-box protein At5g22720 isoform X2 [Lotus japonicus]
MNGNMDMISQLPEPIIHDILSWLPNKDSARTCVLSKTWRYLYATKPIMVFNHFEFDPQIDGHSFISRGIIRRPFLLAKTYSEKKELFMNYVQSSLKRFFHQQQHLPRLRKFDLTVCTYDDKTEQEFGHIGEWLHDVIHNGTDTICLKIMSYHDAPYPLPHFILSSKMLQELCLSGSLLLFAGRDISLPSLRVLSLCNVHHVNDDLVKHFFSGCPLVEVLRIQGCKNLVDLQASCLSRLVELALDSCSFVRTVEVGSLNFKSFSYSRSKTPPNITLLGASKTLTKLKMEICGIGHQSPFHQLSEFVQLEELVLEHVDTGKVPMKISSKSLKRLVIRSLLNMKHVVEIECPNITAMEYTSNLLPFNSLSPLNPEHFRLEFHLVFQHVVWLDALKIIFENGFTFTKYPMACLVLKDHKEVIILDLDGVLIEVMLSFLNRVEDLESTSSIIIKSGFVDVKNEILTPMPPHMAFNVESSWTSNFTQVFLEKLSRKMESCSCFVERDTNIVNIPCVLRQFLSSSYQIHRFVSKWDWKI